MYTRRARCVAVSEGTASTGTRQLGQRRRPTYRVRSPTMALLEDPERNEPRAISRMVPSFAGLRVLEIGSGDGRVTGLLSGRAASVMAIDPKTESIEALRAKWPVVDARAIGIEDVDLPPHSIDVAIFSWSL